MRHPRNRLSRIQQAIEALPEPRRSVYRLHLFQGLGYLEIGAELGLSTGEVERHIAASIVRIDCALRACDD
jgi:RNA polymerase sigma factor (sigma-70 family)